MRCSAGAVQSLQIFCSAVQCADKTLVVRYRCNAVKVCPQHLYNFVVGWRKNPVQCFENLNFRNWPTGTVNRGAPRNFYRGGVQFFKKQPNPILVNLFQPLMKMNDIVVKQGFAVLVGFCYNICLFKSSGYFATRGKIASCYFVI